MSSNSSNSNNSNNPGNAGTSESSRPAEEKQGRGLQALLWVIVVLLVGALTGVVSFLIIAPHIVIFSGGGEAGPLPFVIGADLGHLFTLIGEHIVLSTIGIALLLSLVVVYVRIYRQTRANFALGILIVLIALLLDAVLTYPILQLFISGIPQLELYYSLPTMGDFFTIVAYSVFLYLSLQ